MRSRIIAFTLIFTTLVTGLLSTNLNSAHADGGVGGSATVTVSEFDQQAPTTTEGSIMRFVLDVHAVNYSNVMGTAEVFFKVPGSNDYLKNNGQYVTGYIPVMPTSDDWYNEPLNGVYLSIVVPYSAFPAGSLGKEFIAYPMLVFSVGKFPNVQNMVYSAHPIKVKLTDLKH